MTHASPDTTDATAAQPGTLAGMIADTTPALASIHATQTHRDPWPQWPGDLNHLPNPLRQSAAIQWAGRARNEHRSVHQFSALALAATRARLPLTVLGGLARLVTDEVRHAEVCARMALLCQPEHDPHAMRWPVPTTGWAPAPEDPEGNTAWMAYAVLEACCFGETLSVPMLKAISTVATEPVARAAAEQILRDEHLHARFGWDTLGLLWPRLTEASRASLVAQIPGMIRGFERSCCQDITPAQVAQNPTVTIEPGDAATPNLGTLTPMQYAVIFYATMESEILPALRALEIDADACWLARLTPDRTR